jgi:hypothetical protein
MDIPNQKAIRPLQMHTEDEIRAALGLIDLSSSPRSNSSLKVTDSNDSAMDTGEPNSAENVQTQQAIFQNQLLQQQIAQQVSQMLQVSSASSNQNNPFYGLQQGLLPNSMNSPLSENQISGQTSSIPISISSAGQSNVSQMSNNNVENIMRREIIYNSLISNSPQFSNQLISHSAPVHTQKKLNNQTSPLQQQLIQSQIQTHSPNGITLTSPAQQFPPTGPSSSIPIHINKNIAIKNHIISTSFGDQLSHFQSTQIQSPTSPSTEFVSSSLPHNHSSINNANNNTMIRLLQRKNLQQLQQKQAQQQALLQAQSSAHSPLIALSLPVLNPASPISSSGGLSTSPTNLPTFQTSPQSNQTPTRKRGDGKKCRKVYGIENKDKWCKACLWKKACQRFPD